MTYTSWNTKPKSAKRPQCRADRMVHARRFDSMLRQLGFSRADAAKMLQVSERTLHNWLSGHHAVPYAAYKLVRVLRFQDIPFKSWEGWHFAQGTLWSPEGHGFSGKDGSWWSLLVRQARMFTKLYRERQELLLQLETFKLTETAQIVHDGLVDLGMDGGLPVTQTRRIEGARSAPPAPGFLTEMYVTPQSSPTGWTLEHLDCPSAARFVRSRLGRFLPDGGVQ